MAFRSLYMAGASAIIAIVMLSGCGLSKSARIADRDAKIAACYQWFGEHHLSAGIRCMANAHEAYMDLVRYPDLQRLSDARELAIAMQVERGEIPPAEGTVRRAQIQAEIVEAEEVRNARRAGAVAALMANYKWASPAPLAMPVYTPPPSTTTNCLSNRTGNFTYTNCN
jgi:hypothetical protein